MVQYRDKSTPMHVYQLNKPLLELPSEHPVRRFLDAFVACRRNCVGRELEGIDQAWVSAIDGRQHLFSGFAYRVLSFDVELDGWLQDAKKMTTSERQTLDAIPEATCLVNECRSAATTDGNSDVVEMCDETLRMFKLWAECIRYRQQ